ncbi:hypothetical protein GGR50DRAFT_667772 [Xylaria sp. CBS 124048]|nr:hypothetical protein GGR50DRAFT_667772 [Xylaria sp. CBS 124048]
MTNPTKAAQYLIKLEDARCEGRWDELLELVRKVRKHANDRACLTAAVETEYAIIKASQKQSPLNSTAPVSPSDPEITRSSSRLLAVFAAEQTHPEDRYQAQVCLAWANWALGEYDLALAHIPADQENDFSPLHKPDAVSETTRICAIRATYLKAYCLAQNERTVEALDVCQSAMLSLSHLWNSQRSRPQLQFWAEIFLTEYCMMQTQALENGEKSLEDDDSLAPFRSWAKYWEVTKTQGTPLVGGHGFRGSVPRRRVWNEYYAAVSSILQLDLPFRVGDVNDANSGSSPRSQLQMELKKVETAYEGLLLNETTFPRADEEREEVEKFVAAVMANWRVSVGHTWLEEDLGPGGKEGVSRGVLDILYRAATKTFHSTAILRNLFIVHLAVAEFDLALHAFDSYLEIVKKGKARVDKTGHAESSLDDDATVLETISKAIIALCKYGFRDTAEKARDLGIELEEMLQKSRPPLPKTGGSIPTVDEENGNGNAIHPRLPSSVNALSWQAIGLSQAHWSQVTPDASSRVDLQTKAIRSLQKSLSPETGDPTDVRALFTLSLLLAEQRELTAAIDILKAALMSQKRSLEKRPENSPYWHERSLIPLWHLLALLLSARQDYTMATRACEAAFEQFNDPDVLFGAPTSPGSFRSEHLNEAEARNETCRGLVDEMDDVEKEGIIEVKMTQLALLELLEGPEVAVNASQELLILYTRLFGPVQSKPLTVVPQSGSEPPKSSAGTLRSIRGSIFGTKTDRRNTQSRRSIIGSEKSTIASSRPQTTQTVASQSPLPPSIEVTKENGGVAGSTRSARAASVRERRSESMRRNSLKKRDGTTQQQRSRSSSATPRDRVPVVDEDFAIPDISKATGQLDSLAWSSKCKGTNSQQLPRGRGSLRFDTSVPSAMWSANGSGPSGFDSPHPLPMIKFREDQIERQRHTMLVKVWLMIASFYRCSKMYSEARDAINEANKLADSLKLSISKDSSGSVTTRNPGWGGKICLEELLGDIDSELGLLAISEGTPYIAKAYFEEALMHCPDHPSAIVGLSNILLDIYSEVLLPPPTIPSITKETDSAAPFHSGTKIKKPASGKTESLPLMLAVPLGLGGDTRPEVAASNSRRVRLSSQETPELIGTDGLAPPHKATSLPLLDRLSARDRAYGLLSGLTKLGQGWNYSDAWFALARAHEESGQIDKAKEALWWCVELEEGMGVRNWHCVGVNGYAL